MPNTTPVLDTKALALLALQDPPVTASDKVIEWLTQTESGPVKVPAVGAGSTVITRVAVALVVVAHETVTVYIIVSTPAVTPSTVPVLEINAWPLDAFQVPPVTASDNVIDAVWQTCVRPVIVPAKGAVLTAILVVAVTDPQELLTV